VTTALLLKDNSEPECYLIEEFESCSIGYYEKDYQSCWLKYHLKQCCKGNSYIMQGVYGDKTCWWIYSGFNQSLLSQLEEAIE